MDENGYLFPCIFENKHNICDFPDINSLISFLSEKLHRNISKLKVNICSVFEYKHLCIDNRMLIQMVQNIYYHETECDYNPYIAKWKGENDFRDLNSVGIFSNYDGVQINNKKLSAYLNVVS